MYPRNDGDVCFMGGVAAETELGDVLYTGAFWEGEGDLVTGSSLAT